MTLREQYDSATSLFAKLSTDYPGHPCGPFFLAMTLQAKMADFEESIYEEEFCRHIKSAIGLSDSLRNVDAQDPWAYYFMGMANFQWAVYDARKGKSWSTLQKGIRAKNLLQKCLELDSTLYDALVGLGSYKYWSSVKTEGLNWLPFFGDNRGEGIADLEVASQAALFSRELARNALVWANIQERRYMAAESLAMLLHTIYPESKLFLWELAFARLKGNRNEGALEILDTIFQRLKLQQEHNNYNLFEVGYYRMLCNFNLARYDVAMQEIEYCRKLSLSREVRKRLTQKLDDLDKYEKKLARLTAPNKKS